MSPKGKAAVRSGQGGLEGIHTRTGNVGFAPWPRGQYLLEITEADDSTPTKETGDYMLTVQFRINGAPDVAAEGGRKPLGKTMYCRFPISTKSEEAKAFTQEKLMNFAKAAGVRFDQNDQYVGGVKKFIGQQVVANLGVGKNSKSGEDEQKFNSFLARDAKGVRDEYKEED